MARRLQVIGWGVAFLLASPAVRAQAEKAAERGPEEVTTGEARISMNSEYAKLDVDGVDWEAHEFEDQGRTLVIHGLDRTEVHRVGLTPVAAGLDAIVVEVRPEDWKLVKLDKKAKTLMWRVEKKVTFPKARSKPASGEAPPSGDAPTP